MTTAARRPRVIVIGAGFGGLGAAYELSKDGLADVTVLEKADDIGGVWRENTYPGAACDVPSNLYSYSFATKTDWGRRYAEQPDILGYIQDTADLFGLRKWCAPGWKSSAEYDDHTATWQVATSSGEVLEANVLVPATGQLSRPAFPKIPGLDTFAGPLSHSAEWRHDVDLTGKRIAVLGTGASAIQLCPVFARPLPTSRYFSGPRRMSCRSWTAPTPRPPRRIRQGARLRRRHARFDWELTEL